MNDTDDIAGDKLRLKVMLMFNRYPIPSQVKELVFLLLDELRALRSRVDAIERKGDDDGKG